MMETIEITEAELKELALAIDKPVIKLLLNSEVPYEKWSPNIHRLVEKELGVERKTVILIPKK